MRKILAAAIFISIFLIFSSAVFAQTGVCGSESVSAGIKGEVRLRTQTGGTDLNYDVCWPKACSAGMAASTVISDKYKSGSADAFTYQKICMADVDSLSLSECSGVISNEADKCSPQKCEIGFFDFGIVSEKRGKSGNFWTENVYRLCAKGSKIENATLVFKEQIGSAPTPSACPSNFSDVGVFKEIHFNSSDIHRAWRICAKFAGQNISTTTTSPTTTTAPSNLETAKSTALANISAMLNVSLGNITVDLAEAITWGDSALGCPKPGFGYLQVISPGYRVILSYEGKKYFYHSGSDGKSFYCENPKEPIKATTTSATTTALATTTTAKPTTTTISKATQTYPTTTLHTTTTFYPPLPPEKKTGCSESDSGIAIYSAGSVRAENGTLFIDTCTANNTLISEYYCSNGNVSIYEGNCTAGCLNSACRGAGEALVEKGALFAGRIIDTANYVIDLVARGKILEKGADLVGKVIDTASSFLDFFGKLIGKGSQYVDTIEIANKTANATNLTNATG